MSKLESTSTPVECSTCKKWQYCLRAWVSGKHICRQHTDHKGKA